MDKSIKDIAVGETLSYLSKGVVLYDITALELPTTIMVHKSEMVRLKCRTSQEGRVATLLFAADERLLTKEEV